MAYYLDIAVRRTAEQLGREFYNLPYQPYAPIRQQLLNLLRLVNKERKAAGLIPVRPNVLRYQRRIVRPFDPVETDVAVLSLSAYMLPGFITLWVSVVFRQP